MSVGWFCCQILVFPTGMSVTGLGISPYKHFTTKTSVNERSSLVHLGNQAVTRSIKFIIRSTSVLWSAICFENYDTTYVRFFPMYTCNRSCYTIYVCFFAMYTCILSYSMGFLVPSIWPFSYKRAYICAPKKPIYMRYKQACVYEVKESRRISGTELYRHKKILPVRWSWKVTSVWSLV